MSGDQPRIVVLRAGALGDVLLTVPALQRLRKLHPDHHFQAVGYPSSWAAAGRLVDDVVSIDRPMFSSLFTTAPAPELETWLAAADLLVAWTVRAPRVTAVPTIHVSPYPPPGVHAATWLLRSIDADARLPGDGSPLLPPTDAERRAGHRLLATCGLTHPTILHPGAGAEWKRWPPSRFVELAASLIDRGMEVALVEGPADAEAVAEVHRHVKALPVIRSSDLRTLAGALASCPVYIGSDSGLTHLAAMSGTPTIALFGSTDPESWAPIGDVRIIRACSTHATRQGQVRTCDDPACMSRIKVVDVLLALEGLYGRQDSMGSLSGA